MKQVVVIVSTLLLACLCVLGGASVFAEVETPDYPADRCIFYQTIPYDAPIDPHSDILVEDLIDISPDPQLRLRLGDWNMAIYWISGENYELEDVYLPRAWCPFGYWMRDVPFPTDQVLRVTGDSDSNFAIVDPIRGLEWNFWRPTFDLDNVLARNAQGYYTAENAGVVFTNTSGSNPMACSMRGPSIAHSLGQVRPGELAAGQVNHALCYAFPDPAEDPCPPATYSDGNSFGDINYPVRLPEAARFRLKPSVWTDTTIENATHPDATPWTHTEKALARAARDYGVIVTDNSGCHGFYAVYLGSYPSDPYVDIPGCEPEYRSLDGSFVPIFQPYLLGPDNFEVIDTIYFPYPREARWADYDGDGISNSAEIAWGYHDFAFADQTLDPSNGAEDWDHDGLTNAEEWQFRSDHRYMPLNPFDADSDGDGYTDFEEAADWSADPTNPWRVPDPNWPGPPAGPNLALNKAAFADFGDGLLAVDGDESTACAGRIELGEITVDLGAQVDLDRVLLKWLGNGFCFGLAYAIQVSPDNADWTTIYAEPGGEGGVDDIWGLAASGRYLRVTDIAAASQWCLELCELEVYGSAPPLPPVADFRVVPAQGNPPLPVQFVDLSSWSPTAWYWDFGDNGHSAVQDPSHDYHNEGSYSVSLTVDNAQGQDTETKPGYVLVTNNTCHVASIDLLGYYRDASIPEERGYFAEATITIHDQLGLPVDNANVSIIWGGSVYAMGSAKTDGYGEVTFDSPGERVSGYFVCCVTDVAASGYPYAPGQNLETCDEMTYPLGEAPVANFGADITVGAAPLTVNFTDESLHSPTAWDWSFGDGGTSYLRTPGHEYMDLGSYTVAVTAFNDYGRDTETKIDYITVNTQSCHVGEITLASAGAPEYRAVATIAVHDQDCVPLQGVTVEVTWSGAAPGSDSGVTNESGQVTLTSGRKKSGGAFTICVDDLTKTGYLYQPGNNHETCDSIMLP